MNDQHPHAGYDAYATGSFDTDPLFGVMPGGHEDGHLTHGGQYDSGQYDATQWSSASSTGHEVYGDAQHAYGQQYDATHFDGAQYDATGQWDANAWNEAGQFTATQFESAAQTYDTGGQWTTAGYGAATSYETGAYDATAWNSAGADATAVHPQYGDHTGQLPGTGHSEYPGYGEQHDPAGTFAHEQLTPAAEFGTSHETQPGTASGYETEAEHGAEPGFGGEAAIDSAAEHSDRSEYSEYEPERPAASDAHDGEPDSGHDHEAELIAGAATVAAPAVTLPSAASARPVRRAGGARGRRRTPAKRSALLTVAVPSVCVMGVAGVAAASVGGLTDGEQQKDANTAVTAADASSVKPVAANNALDTQLAALNADVRDFGDRASRTQERIDLKARQEAERKKREEEAALRERLRPKFALPVAQRGLSAYYGQAGVNWMSMHTGIDFPVSYGTPVMAATDGTVRTQWNSAYGNMAIVTAADGTETWYCHLSSTKIRSGKVKAGEVIAYSGNSGNSTGPHLHFEVRPGGGAAIDPLSWLRSHGLSPT
ncbi:M23 family metallopeptidase [Streptomyces sp. HNM0645]|uniref:M23 family metallopeptidase n=1 Tax=Streptomyces sp. HNM0645 TaxID=2782343 RepID=UPI0024B83EA9|nr:M23 family metallopeptidase [Streptomyces sp. HNM0645]MDI9884065.1 M23 family metallopeptidase [Streptomyces sp. HNM0645]